MGVRVVSRLSTRAGAWSLIVAGLTGPAVLAGVAVGQPNEGELAATAAQLGAAQFARREAASRDLVEWGLASLPALAAAVRSDDLEVASRGVEVLGRLLVATDPVVVAGAERSLESLAAEPEQPVARQAAAVLDFHRAAAAAAAREALEGLGAIVRERSAVDRPGIEVEIDTRWRGTAADFRHLAFLRGLDAVSIRGVAIDDSVLELLGGLRAVSRLELFGTGAGREAAALLAAKLPDARIDVRKGGKLGVSSAALGGPCEIRIVEPGSAADEAGLRSGDVVLAIDGAEITGFEELTSRLADRGPGEEVRLTIARRGGTADGEPERLECAVRLDAW